MHTAKKLIAIAGLTIGLGIGASSCAGGGEVQVRSTATYDAGPRLVAIGPDLWVIEDYDRPVFYSDGYYWLHSRGFWYRSSYHTGGWVQARPRALPRALYRIDRPTRYVRYRARSNARVRRGPPPRSRVRDHRTDRDRYDRRGRRIR
jgi:hypothetical protein